MGVTMVRITISGRAGSGTSTLVNGLVEHFDWGFINGGQIFRDEAQRRGLTLSEFDELCKSEVEVDRELDSILQAKMLEEGGEEIVESRLAGWWAYKLSLPCIRLWLHVDQEERARRVTLREGLNTEDALANIIERATVLKERFQMLYGLEPGDPEPYTHIIDGTKLDAEQLLAKVITLLEDSK